MISLYDKIKTRLKDITALKQIGIYNQQHLHIKEEVNIAYPSAWVEFSNVEYDTMQDQYQLCHAEMIIHIYQENYQVDKEKVFELFQKVTAKLHKWNPNLYSTNIVRTKVDFDYNTDSIHHTMIYFNVSYVDQTMYNENDFIEATVNEIIVQIKRESNNALYQTFTIN